MKNEKGDDVCHPRTRNNTGHSGEVILNSVSAQIGHQPPRDQRPCSEKKTHEESAKHSGVHHQPNEPVVKTTLIDVDRHL